MALTFPTLICKAHATARLSCPETLFAGHDSAMAVAGYMPPAHRNVAKYCTPVVDEAIRMMYPMIARAAPPMMNGARRLM